MNTALKRIIDDALLKENHKYLSAHIPKNKCSVDNCFLESLSHNLCNAHYIRKRKNRDLNILVRNRSIGKNCIDCNKPISKKGGFNRCVSHYKQRRLKIIKESIIEWFGGSCQKCKKSYPYYVYDFHHKDKSQKDFSPGLALATRSTETISKELIKCELLCSNCHREVHNG